MQPALSDLLVMLNLLTPSNIWRWITRPKRRDRNDFKCIPYLGIAQFSSKNTKFKPLTTLLSSDAKSIWTPISLKHAASQPFRRWNTLEESKRSRQVEQVGIVHSTCLAKRKPRVRPNLFNNIKISASS